MQKRVDDEVVILSNDEDKVSAFCNYFSSVFTIDHSTTTIVDDDQENKILNETDLVIPLSNVQFNDLGIFKALDKFNIYKSPGPGGLATSRYILEFCSKQEM